MDETIGVKGGHNDLLRTKKIIKAKEEKEKGEAEEKELKELEKRVKKTQRYTLIKTLPLVIVGGTVKSIYDSVTSNKTSSTDDISYKENSLKDNNYKEHNGNNPDSKINGRRKIIVTTPNGKVVVNVCEENEKKNFIEDLLTPEEEKKDTNLVGEKPVRDVQQDFIFIPRASSHKKGIGNTYDTILESGANISLSSNDKLSKLKARKIVDEYEKQLKDVRYDLRKLVFEYNVLVSESDEITVSKQAEDILDKLSDVISKIEALKNKIKIEDLDKYDDNYIYTLVEEYLKEFKDKKFVSEIKDSPLYVAIEEKLEELDSKKTKLGKKVEEKKEKLEEKEEKFDKLKEKFYNVEKFNKELYTFQIEQQRVLEDLQRKVADALTVSERVEVQAQMLNKQSRNLLRRLRRQIFFPGPRMGKRMSLLTAIYLRTLHDMIYPPTETKKYKVIKVEDYSKDIEYSISTIDDSLGMLTRTNKQIDKIIKQVKNEFSEYIGVIKECDELLSNLNKIKGEMEEKEYEINKIKKEQEKVLEKNNAKVLKRGVFKL
jgi:hypothetical protein